MARTSGHGNPNWTRDETLLALDLYFRLDGRVPSPSASEVQELSGILRALPYHAEAAKRPSFRNPDGVGFKLMNLRQVATGRGLGNVSRTDREIWERYGNRPKDVRRIAQGILSGMTMLEAGEILPDDEEFSEGRILTALHLKRERNPKARAMLLDDRRSRGLSCEVCGLARPDLGPELQEALFEAHHVIPLAEAGERRTKLSDLSLLCACCHRLIHRAITINGSWLSVAEGRSLIAER